jgi:hypothetical protein
VLLWKNHSEIPSFGQIEFREAWRVLEGFSKMSDEPLEKISESASNGEQNKQGNELG